MQRYRLRLVLAPGKHRVTLDRHGQHETVVIICVLADQIDSPGRSHDVLWGVSKTFFEELGIAFSHLVQNHNASQNTRGFLRMARKSGLRALVIAQWLPPSHHEALMRFAPILIFLLAAFESRAVSEGDISAVGLLAVTKHGQLIKETENKFQTDLEKPKNVSMYSLTGATFWTADMDIDCDGRATPFCNKKTDPDFQNQLSCGADIAADETPYFVIPIGSPADSKKRGIQMGQIAAIIYSNQVVYALFLDECGIRTLIGEASCATARLLGIDPDPKTGGTDGPVTYLVFTGPSGRITNPQDYANHAKAIEIGNRRASELVGRYSAGEASHSASEITQTKKAPTSPNENRPSKTRTLKDYLLPASKHGGFRMDDYILWCPTVIKVGDVYHLFASRWPAQYGLGGWTSHSECVRATSTNLLGPYAFQEVVLQKRPDHWDNSRVHNPKIVKAGSKYVLYYINSANQTGYAVSDSVSGPWTRSEKVAIHASNPAPLVKPDHGIYCFCRLRDAAGVNRGVAVTAPSIEGPYSVLANGDNLLPNNNELEDPTIWWANNQYNVVLNDWKGKATGIGKAGVEYYSRDGLHYQLASPEPVFNKTVTYDDGTTETFSRRERPFVYVNERSEVVAFFTACLPANGPARLVAQPVNQYLPGNAAK